jgi:hypothetical protein
MTAGLNPHGHTTDWPNPVSDNQPNGPFPEWTQCADYSFNYNAGQTANQYEAIISGSIGNRRFAVELVVDKDLGGPVVGEHYTGIHVNAALPVLMSKDGPHGWERSDQGGTFTVNPDQKSGTINLVVSTGHNVPTGVTITGSWRCG